MTPQGMPLLLHEKVKRFENTVTPTGTKWGLNSPHATASRAEEGAREDIERH